MLVICITWMIPLVPKHAVGGGCCFFNTKEKETQNAKHMHFCNKDRFKAEGTGAV